MAYSITEVKNFDHKRNKVTLDNGEVTFLLYKGECKRFRIKSEETSGDETKILSEEQYREILEDILIPRARKRILYYLKNADKTRSQIRVKLREALYPEEVIDKTFEFLDKYGFADDDRYADAYIEELKGKKSMREIEMKLAQKGIKGNDIKEKLSAIEPEAERTACEQILRKRYRNGITPDEKRKAFGYLARRGFSFDVIEQAVSALLIEAETSFDEFV